MRNHLSLFLPSLLIATLHCGGEPFSSPEIGGAAGALAGTSGAAGAPTAGAAGSNASGAAGAGQAGAVGGQGGAGQAGAGGDAGAGMSGASGQGGAGQGGDAGAGAGGAGGGQSGAGGGGQSGAGGAASAGQGGDAGQGGAAGVGGGAAGDGGAGGSGPVDCPVLHVSPQGSASNDGCSPESPLRQVGQAISRASKQKLAVSEIRVCRGTYKETLTLDVAVSLEGDYDCDVWLRPDSTGTAVAEEAPGTVLLGDGPTALTVTGQAIGAGVHIRGFTIRGIAPLKEQPSVALSIEQGAAPSVEGNHILGLPDSSLAVRSSVGLQIKGAGGTIAHNLIHGGKGKASQAAATASRGVLVDGPGGAITLEANVIDGGEGLQQIATGGIGSLGLDIRGRPGAAGSLVARRNQIRGGRGRAAQGLHGAGVNVEDSSGVELLGNDVRGNSDGGQTVATKPSTITGIRLLGAADVRVTGNRIYAGESVATTTGLTSLTGVSLNRCEGVDIDSNVVHGGNGLDSTFHTVTRGIALTTVTDLAVNDPPNSHVSLRSNTVLSGLRGGPGLLSAALQVSGPQSDLAVVNNLLVSEAKTGAAAGSVATVLHFPDCYQDAIATYQGNALVSAGEGLLAVAIASQNASASQACKQLSAGTTMGNATVSLLKANSNDDQSVSIKDTLVLTASCSDEDHCTAVPACGTTAGCLGELFTAPSFGMGTLPLFTGGFQLRDESPCPLRARGVPSVASDLLLAPRTPPYSVGAYEHATSADCL